MAATPGRYPFAGNGWECRRAPDGDAAHVRPFIPNREIRLMPNREIRLMPDREIRLMPTGDPARGRLPGGARE